MADFLAYGKIKRGTGFLPGYDCIYPCNTIEEAIDKCEEWKEHFEPGLTWEIKPGVYCRNAYYIVTHKEKER